MFEHAVLLVDRDPDAARNWEEKAAQQGDGRRDVQPRGHVVRQRSRAWFEQAATHGDRRARLKLGVARSQGSRRRASDANQTA